MKSFRHWTPRYVVNRLAEMRYRSKNPGLPWLTEQANSILDTYLKPSDRGLEFGSGRSTAWLAERVEHVTSVEHNEQWFAIVEKMFAERKIENVDYQFCPKVESTEDPGGSKYVTILDKFEVASLDFVLVDGIYRDHCASLALDKIRPGGMLIVDNAERYFPRASYSPDSMLRRGQPIGPLWKKVQIQLEGWRLIWTNSGVTDTAFYFKPCAS